MLKLYHFMLCFILAASSFAQNKLTSAEWQADVKFLQQTVHKDYSFLFKKVTAEKFDAEVEKLYKLIPELKEYEIIAGIDRLVSLFQYGHTSISWLGAPVSYHVAPVNLYWFSDGIYIEGIDKEYTQALGAKVLKVEGMPVEKALEAIKPLVPAENDQFFKAHGLDYLIIPEALSAQKITKELKSTVTFTIEKDGKTFEQVFKTKDPFRLPRAYGFVKPDSNWMSVRDQVSTPYYLKHLDKIYYFEYLPDNKTVYVRHSQIQDDPDEAIPAFYKRVFDFIEHNDVEKLVLDVRLNGGGNNYKNKPIITGIIQCKKINLPGKLYVIIGRRTFSACQNLVNEFSNYTNAIFVGEPTAENINFYGDTRKVELPNSKIPVFLSFAWWQDKPQWENAPWLAPQMAVDMSFDDYRSNRDPVLAACLDFSEKDPVIDPLVYLKELFMAGKKDELVTEAKRMVGDPKYRYVDFEGKINSAGYDLLNSKQLESALFVFQLNTELYPESANVWDSFAEACWKANQTDKAIKYYNKAIGLDPAGNTGQHARDMLKQIHAEKENASHQ